MEDYKLRDLRAGIDLFFSLSFFSVLCHSGSAIHMPYLSTLSNLRH
jgi:hypothetical protein